MQPIACSTITADQSVGLEDLNITLRSPIGDAVMWLDPDGIWRKEVGRVTVHIETKAIEIWPAENITEKDLGELRGAAFEATWLPPTADRDWSLVTSKTRGQYWEGAVVVAPEASDPMVRAYRTALTARKRQNRAHSEAFDAVA